MRPARVEGGRDAFRLGAHRLREAACMLCFHVMTERAWVRAVEDDEFVAALRRRLGLPTEPVAAALRELADAQHQTEQRVGQLVARVEQLAEAQQRTEHRIEQLAEAQQRTEHLGCPVFAWLVGYAVHPSARRIAESEGVVIATIREVRAVPRAA